ncbi:hypothetical protein TSUD_348880 [Trifolium subterraneum]|uniref:Reverse transcriptase zinc-binding domain-containing protein n=1 Tax=Trifolium subterraneum TaxID=3900 RepID=A0A2Z6NAM7_TRISU|nr:hypothetical protein TSUD_348880 [Trifolium subterraneum]
MEAMFADDTLLLGVKSWANVRALRVVLVLFEAMSGLKVNFNKSMNFYWGGWFGKHISKKVGDGSDTFFWTDPWTAETPLCERFGRLFDLAETKSATMAEMFALGWGDGGEAWADSSDRWLWQPGPATGYSVRGAYHLLTSQDFVTLDDATGLIWHTQVPLKVSIFAWRLLRDRLPTKTNLVSRDILSPEAHHCVSGCGIVESTQHLFLSCSTFGSLWSLVSSWIDSTLVDSQTLPDHFMQFTSSAGVSRARRSFMQLIWLACVWVVWHERNQRLFRGSANSVHHMLDKIKFFSFRWLKTTNNTLTLNYHCWWSSPLVCLNFV